MLSFVFRVPPSLVEQPLPNLIHVLVKMRGHDKAAMFPHGFLAGISEDALGRGIPGGHAEVKIPFHHRQWSVLQVNPQLLLRPAKLLLCTFAVSDVAADAKQSYHLAVGAAIRRLARKVGPGHARGSPGFLVGFRPAGLDHCAVALHDRAARSRIEHFGVVLPQDIRDALAKKTGARRVDHQVAPLQIFDPDRVRRALGDALQQSQILLQLAGTDEQLVLDEKNASARGGERYRHQHYRPQELLLRNAQDQRKHHRRNQQRRELGEQLQTVGMRRTLGLLLPVIPSPGDYDQQTEAQGPGKVRPPSLLVVPGSLVGQRGIENDAMESQKTAHAQEKCSLRSMETQQAPHQETQSDQAKEVDSRVQRADLHRLSRSLPARRHVNLRQFDCQGERADLHKVAHSQPTVSAARVPGLRNSVIMMGTIQKKTRTSLGHSVPSGACT